MFLSIFKLPLKTCFCLFVLFCRLKQRVLLYDSQRPKTGVFQNEEETTEQVPSNMGLDATNLSSGFLIKRDSNQFPQLQRLARKLKFRL